jgi:protein-tyrosine phosphatase
MEKKEKYRVLFVCLGNICRSQAGEGIFKKIIKEKSLEHRFYVDSAGTSGWHTSELPDRRMRQHGEKRGYSFDSRSRKFLARDFDDFDYILAMDDNNYYDILSLASDVESQQKVHRMTDYLQRMVHDHIPDPYYSGAEGFELVLDLLEDACDGLLNEIELMDGKK